MTIHIPTFDWKQIGGDMSPGAHGGIIARADGTSIEVREIQPAREYVGDGEACEVGFPFWSKDGWYDASDLDPARDEVQSALRYCGLDLADVPEDCLALAIAECLLTYGSADGGPAGWSEDVVPGPVLWWHSAEPQGPEYLSDEDTEFACMLAEHDADMSDKARELYTAHLQSSLTSDLDAIVSWLEGIAADCEQPCGECGGCELDAECENAIDRIDVRLQVSTSGTWDVHSGDSQYDTDHTGFWGASCVAHDDTPESLKAVAEDLISQALDAAAEHGVR